MLLTCKHCVQVSQAAAVARLEHHRRINRLAAEIAGDHAEAAPCGRAHTHARRASWQPEHVGSGCIFLTQSRARRCPAVVREFFINHGA